MMDESYNEDDTDTAYYYALLSTEKVIAISAIGTILWCSDLSVYNESYESYESSRVMVKADSNWFHLSYVDSGAQLVALSHSGSIVTIDTMSGETDIVGSFDNGIDSGSWSPDSEQLCLITRQTAEIQECDDATNETFHGVIIIMNSRFEIMVEADFPALLSQEAIYITWKFSDNSLIAVSSVDKEDSIRRVRIFDASTLSNFSVSRSEDGSGKLLSNLASCNLAWAGPNCSNLIAAVQKRGRNGWEVVFLESNGLQHGGFKLRTVNYDQVYSIIWNPECDLFAVVLLNNRHSELGGTYRVQLYHRSNYHWYLKREIEYDVTILPGTIEFDRFKNMNLLASLQYRESDVFECRDYEFSWDFSSGSGAVAVIDGKNLNITHLDRALVPPPMCAYSLEAPFVLSEVNFVPSYLLGQNHDVGVPTIHAIASSDQGYLLFIGSRSLAHSDSIMGLAAFDMKSDLNMLPYSSCLRQFTPVQISCREKIIFITLLAFGCIDLSERGSWADRDELFELSFQIDFGSDITESGLIGEASLRNMHRQKIYGRGMRFAHWITFHPLISDSVHIPGTALVQLEDSSLYEYKSGLDFALTKIDEPELCFPEPCPKFIGIRSGNKRVVIGISKRSRLYIGERLLHHSVSSFELSPAHSMMAFSTLGSSSYLHFIPFDSLVNFDPLSALEDAALEGYESRNLERNSMLVTIFSHRPEAVFLLPRGNIELLCPRGLLIPFVVRLLQQENYVEAFVMIRKQKLDVNLLCDVDPVRFLMRGGIESFLEQVRNVDHINLFIAGLTNTDVTKTKYPILNWFRSEDQSDSKNIFDFSTKINQICLRMRSVMIDSQQSGTMVSRRVSSNDFLLPILSTYAKEQPNQLDKALLLIKSNSLEINCDYRGEERKEKARFFSDKTQGAIQYLAFLSNYETLFDTALGLYDFELAKAVARNSQLDPKVYLPLLKHFTEIPTYRARYEVDLRLHRYESALRNLASYHEEMHVDIHEEQQRFSECLSFIEEHKLHRLGLELFRHNQTNQNKVICSLGNLMMQEGNAENALAIFTSMKPIDYKCVLRAALKCGDWQSYFAYHNLMTDDVNNRKHDNSSKDIAVSLANEMISHVTFHNRRSVYSNAARIVLDYDHNPQAAIEYLISGQLWFEARRLSVYYGLEELHTKVKDEAYAAAENHLFDLEEKNEKFRKAIDRFVTLSNICQELKRQSFQSEFPMERDDETGSLFSVASKISNASIFSSSSKSSMSSVISTGQSSTFSIVGGRSAINQPMMGKKKSKKQKSKEKNKMRPEDELKSLVIEMKACVPDDHYSIMIAETLKFLLQESYVKIAVKLYNAYNAIQQFITDSVQSRIEQGQTTVDKNESGMNASEYGSEVMSFKCAQLPSHLSVIFSYAVKLE